MSQDKSIVETSVGETPMGSQQLSTKKKKSQSPKKGKMLKISLNGKMVPLKIKQSEASPAQAKNLIRKMAALVWAESLKKISAQETGQYKKIYADTAEQHRTSALAALKKLTDCSELDSVYFHIVNEMTKLGLWE